MRKEIKIMEIKDEVDEEAIYYREYEFDNKMKYFERKEIIEDNPISRTNKSKIIKILEESNLSLRNAEKCFFDFLKIPKPTKENLDSILIKFKNYLRFLNLRFLYDFESQNNNINKLYSNVFYSQFFKYYNNLNTNEKNKYIFHKKLIDDIFKPDFELLNKTVLTPLDKIYLKLKKTENLFYKKTQKIKSYFVESINYNYESYIVRLEDTGVEVWCNKKELNSNEKIYYNTNDIINICRIIDNIESFEYSENIISNLLKIENTSKDDIFKAILDFKKSVPNMDLLLRYKKTYYIKYKTYPYYIILFFKQIAYIYLINLFNENNNISDLYYTKLLFYANVIEEWVQKNLEIEDFDILEIIRDYKYNISNESLSPILSLKKSIGILKKVLEIIAQDNSDNSEKERIFYEEEIKKEDYKTINIISNLRNIDDNSRINFFFEIEKVKREQKIKRTITKVSSKIKNNEIVNIKDYKNIYNLVGDFINMSTLNAYVFSYVEELIGAFLLHILEEKDLIKLCENCHKPFKIETLKDKYCKYIFSKNKICKDVGWELKNKNDLVRNFAETIRKRIEKRIARISPSNQDNLFVFDKYIQAQKIWVKTRNILLDKFSNNEISDNTAIKLLEKSDEVLFKNNEYFLDIYEQKDYFLKCLEIWNNISIKIINECEENLLSDEEKKNHLDRIDKLLFNTSTNSLYKYKNINYFWRYLQKCQNISTKIKKNISRELNNEYNDEIISKKQIKKFLTKANEVLITDEDNLIKYKNTEYFRKCLQIWNDIREKINYEYEKSAISKNNKKIYLDKVNNLLFEYNNISLDKFENTEHFWICLEIWKNITQKIIIESKKIKKAKEAEEAKKAKEAEKDKNIKKTKKTKKDKETEKDKEIEKEKEHKELIMFYLEAVNKILFNDNSKNIDIGKYKNINYFWTYLQNLHKQNVLKQKK